MSDLFGSSVELVAFEGSRSLAPSWSPLVSSLVGSVRSAGFGVATGCAGGLDSLVREVCPSAVVFEVGAFRGRGAYASRSARLLGASSKLVAFPSSACPSLCVPSRSFRGFGSGTWGGIALAVGSGLPVVVFRVGAFELPRWSGGSWVLVGGSSVWARGFRWVAS